MDFLEEEEDEEYEQMEVWAPIIESKTKHTRLVPAGHESIPLQSHPAIPDPLVT